MILILGVTASGKGGVAFELARKIGAEIISIDSMKVYRRMDIGTAKLSLSRRRQVKYHLIDVVEPYDSFSLGKYVRPKAHDRSWRHGDVHKNAALRTF